MSVQVTGMYAHLKGKRLEGTYTGLDNYGDSTRHIRIAKTTVELIDALKEEQGLSSRDATILYLLKGLDNG